MTLEKQVLGIRKNSLKKMTLEKQVLGINQNLLVLLITQNILEKNHLMSQNQIQKMRVLILGERKNLKVGIIDRKILALKNIAKKQEVFKIF